MYNFGVYHWKRHLGSVIAVACALAASAVALARAERTATRFAVGAIAVSAVVYGSRIAGKLFRPVPWAVGHEKYDDLAEIVPLERADQVLDVGCGTGRSIVGLAPFLPDECRVTGLDVFDDRIVLGNTPERARANGAAAGLDARVVTGDATRLPIASDSHDVIVISRLLHDLPEDEARRTLAEARRAMSPDGTLGVVELPIVPGGEDAESYWRELVTDAGFEVEAVRRPPWKYERDYVVLAASSVRR